MARTNDTRERAPDEKRMTLGQHLDELRWVLVRSLVALFLACLICIFLARYLLEILVRPLIMALRANNHLESLLATSPVETIVVYIKVVVIFGLIIAAPYILNQLWSFIAAGLYAKEKEWVYRLVPLSIGLFVAGVVFMYIFALVVSLNFLIGFNNWLPMPSATPTSLEKTLLGIKEEAVTSQPALQDWTRVPVLSDDPDKPQPGLVWFNMPEHRLKIRAPEQTFSYQFQRDARRSMVTPHFKIGEYLTFVLVLTIAFGVAFQLPLVVVFLARTGIVPLAKLRRSRKLAIFIIVVIAAALAPPDLLSHLLLAGPMILLYEVGLFVAGRQEQSRRRNEGGPLARR